MEISVSSYLSPESGQDYSLKFEIGICNQWAGSTVRANAPIQIRSFARELARLDATSSEVLLDLSCAPDGMAAFEVRIAPCRSMDMAAVDVRTVYVQCHGDDNAIHTSEKIMRELVPIARLNRAGQKLLAVSQDTFFEFRFSEGN